MRAPVIRLVGVVGGAFLFAACSDQRAPVEPAATPAPAVTTLRTDGYILVMKQPATLANIRVGARLGTVIRLASRRGQDAIVTQTIPRIRGVAVRGLASANDAASDDVAAVLPNYEADIISPIPLDAGSIYGIDDEFSATGTDQSAAFFFANNFQWSYKRISANRVWSPSRGGAGAKVCIIDSGIDPGHTDFAGKSIVSTSFLTNSDAQTDTSGHGSHVAGTISTNGLGGASVAPDASLMTAKIFNGAGGGGTTSNILNAVIWCTDNGADVINMSLGFTGGIPVAGNSTFISIFQSVMDYATSNGVLIVAAAGNDARTLPVAGLIFLPAEANGVTSVAATAPATNLTPFGTAAWLSPGADFDGIASYSNRGPVPSVDISAPGGDLFTGWPTQSLIMSVCSRQFRSGTTFPCAGGNSYLFEGGTSQATPHVSGVAALIRARWPATPRSTALRNKIESCLYRSVDVIGPSGIFGRGRLNAFKAATQPC
jgi:subtilisin family serine protease